MANNHNDKQKDIDSLSGVETTGHEWDGIKELNNPAPRWWLWVFFITCIWAFGYWVVYPTWPTWSGKGERGGTEGSFKWTQYRKLKNEQAEIIAVRKQYLDDFTKKSFDDILKDPQLYTFAIAGGKSAFKDNCSTCHGTGGAGGNGYPNLNDDDWIWGGDMNAIYQTLQYGIRSNHADTRTSQMPSFKDILSKDDMNHVADYLVGLAKNETKENTKGQIVFSENCSSCHGNHAKGGREFGAPNLVDSIWLYGTGDKHDIIAQMINPKHGVMPAWHHRLDAQTIRQLTIYVHQLGGGE